MFSNKKKDYFWNTIGTFLQSALSPILLIIVTRINGIDQSGIFSFAFSVSVAFWVISLWGGRTYQVSDVKNRFSYEQYILSRLLVCLLTFVGSLVFVFLNNYDINKSSLIITLVLIKIMESVADVFYGVMQSNKKLYLAGMSLAYKTAISTIAFGAVDVLTKNVLLGCVAILAVNISMLIFYDIKKTLHIKKINLLKSGLEYRQSIQIIKKCTPAFIIGFLGLLPVVVSRYFIDLNSVGDSAYFGIFSMPVTLVGLLVVFAIQPNVVRLSESYAKKDKNDFYGNVKTIIGVVYIVGALSLVAAWVVGVPILDLVFGIDSGQHKISLIFMVFGAIFNAIISIYTTIFTIIRKFKQHILVLFITNLLLVIFYVLSGSAISLFVASVCFSVIGLVQVVVLTKIIFKNKEKNA